MPAPTPTSLIRVRQPAGTLHHLLSVRPGATVEVDADANGVLRRVLVRDVVRERAAEVDRRINDMMGHDVRAAARGLRETKS